MPECMQDSISCSARFSLVPQNTGAHLPRKRFEMADPSMLTDGRRCYFDIRLRVDV